MAKLARVLQKVFGSSGGTGEFGQIGSDSAGTPTTTKNLATIQALAQYDAGLFAITNNANEPPRIQDINALYFLLSSQLKYLFQNGIPEWIATEDYYANVSFVIGSNGAIYRSKTGTDGSPNINNNPVGDATNWETLASVLFDSPALTGTPTAPTASPGTNTTQIATTAFVRAADDLKANLASPTFTGTPAAPTASAGTNTTQLATTAFVNAEITNDRPYSSSNPLMDGTAAQGSSPNVSRQDHVHPTDTSRAPLASPALTGTPTAPTAATSTNTTQIATTAFVRAQLLGAIYPIGCYYTQYPDASSNTDATEFPTAQRPETLFGGTWVEQWSTESIYFRTRGTLSDSGRTSGKQEDAFQGHRMGPLSPATFYISSSSGGTGGSGPYGTSSTTGDPVTDGTNGTPRTATETRVVNRRIKVWKRTA